MWNRACISSSSSRRLWGSACSRRHHSLSAGAWPASRPVVRRLPATTRTPMRMERVQPGCDALPPGRRHVAQDDWRRVRATRRQLRAAVGGHQTSHRRRLGATADAHRSRHANAQHTPTRASHGCDCANATTDPIRSRSYSSASLIGRRRIGDRRRVQTDVDAGACLGSAVAARLLRADATPRRGPARVAFVPAVVAHRLSPVHDSSARARHPRASAPRQGSHVPQPGNVTPSVVQDQGGFAGASSNWPCLRRKSRDVIDSNCSPSGRA